MPAKIRAVTRPMFEEGDRDAARFSTKYAEMIPMTEAMAPMTPNQTSWFSR